MSNHIKDYVLELDRILSKADFIIKKGRDFNDFYDTASDRSMSMEKNTYIAQTSLDDFMTPTNR
jgi:hypothetical protein